MARATRLLERATLAIALFLWIMPPLLLVLHPFASMPLGCDVLAFWAGDPMLALVLLVILAVLWLLALALTVTTVRLRKERVPGTGARRRIIALSLVSLCLGTAVAAYGGYEIGIEVQSKLARFDLVSMNVATPVFSSADYNAFPKLLALQNGSLWSAWYAGNWHIDSNNDGKILQSFSHDHGGTWSSPVVIADDATWDTRNPALGQLPNGTLILMVCLYDYTSRTVIRSAWQQSDDGGLTWSASAPVEPVGGEKFTWLSPFGNLFSMDGHLVAAFYGGDASLPGTPDRVALLEFNTSSSTWNYRGSPMEDASNGFNEADVEQVGSGWLCVSRAKTPYLHYSYSYDGITWTAPVATPYKLGHSPDIVVLGEDIGTWSLFLVHRGDHGILRGGLATYDPATNEFTAATDPLFTTPGRGGGDFGYASAVLLPNQSVGFVNYDVVTCGAEMVGTIWWQTWSR